MFVSLNWISDFVDLSGLDPHELLHRFTLGVAEVEDMYVKGADIRNVVVGEILTCEKHPNSRKLHLLTVDVGGRTVNIVCGAPNARVGIKVPVCLDGGRVCEGEINTCMLAGYESQGMCCSQRELGVSDDHSGLWELDADLVNGTDLCDIYDIKDIVFEIDNKSLTNRPDLWGHYGLAREFSALTKRPLKPVELWEGDASQGEVVPVTVERTDLVYRYIALRLTGINKTVSPVNMQIRLYYCGMRGINLLADLTNYVMLELGQPMHAFDARKIQSIEIGTPSEPLKFKTLDDVERDIDENTLLIKNNGEPVAIAGIMGGLDSEIVGTTDTVVLESANFDAVSVRKSSSRLALRTDASQRYEKTLDPELTMTATRRFVKLLMDIEPNTKIDSAMNDVYVKHYPEITLTFDKKFVDRYTGIDISEDEICETLTALGFGVCHENHDFTVKVPSWRATKDVTIKADIIEEITRIYGYDNFEITTAKCALRPTRQEVTKSEDYSIKDLLVNRYNLHEVHSYIWCDGKKYKKLGIDVEDNVRILNISTPENGTIRNSMVPTLLTMAYENKSFASSFGIFEIGRVADGYEENGYCTERRRLGIVLYSKESTEKELYFKMLAMIRGIFSEVKHDEPVLTKAGITHNWQHPKNTAIIEADGLYCGYMCTLHPTVRGKIDKVAQIVAAELYLDNFYKVPVKSIEFSEPSKFPSVDVDLSMVLNAGQRYSEIKNSWESLEIKELKNVSLVDIYEVAGVKSIAVRLTFVSDERTLETSEINAWTDSILENLAKIGVTLKS